jgi:hypothetical protein
MLTSPASKLSADGYGYGPSIYTVVENPRAVPYGARWCSGGLSGPGRCGSAGGPSHHP